MAVEIEGIGHCALRVRDVERSRRFYVNVLGFELLEQDSEHGGAFLSLPGTSHTIDVFALGEMDATTEEPPGPSPLLHIAFRVGSYAALREAHDTLLEKGVKICLLCKRCLFSLQVIHYVRDSSAVGCSVARSLNSSRA